MIFKELRPFISSEAAAQADPEAVPSQQARMDRATVVGEIISCMVKGRPEPSLSLRAAAAGESRKRSPLPFPLRELRCKAQNRHMQAKCGIYISCMNPFTYTDYLET